MIRAQIDKGTYEPKKEVKYPYIATTRGGKVVLVLREDLENDDVSEGVILRQGSDALSVGNIAHFDDDNLTPLAEGESLVITNTWEIADG